MSKIKKYKYLINHQNITDEGSFYGEFVQSLSYELNTQKLINDFSNNLKNNILEKNKRDISEGFEKIIVKDVIVTITLLK
jgi:hypothetical protein